MKARSKFSNRTIASGLFALGLLIQPLLIRAQWDYGNTSMISDLKARGIGDILTVVIQETKETSKNTQAKSSKSSGIDASIQSLFYPPSATSLLKKKGELPALKLNSSSQFQGGGNISSSERIASRISVRVVDVLPNRHFLVEGTQLTSFGGETQEAILKGASLVNTIGKQDINTTSCHVMISQIIEIKREVSGGPRSCKYDLRRGNQHNVISCHDFTDHGNREGGLRRAS